MFDTMTKMTKSSSVLSSTSTNSTTSEIKKIPSFEASKFNPENYSSGLKHIVVVQLLWKAKSGRVKLSVKHKNRVNMIKEIVHMQSTLLLMLGEVSKVRFLTNELTEMPEI